MAFVFSTPGKTFAVLLLTSFGTLAAPVAVNDNFTTLEDTPAGSSVGEVLNAGFEPAGGGPTFSLPNAWQILDLNTSAAGGNNTYPADTAARTWRTAGFDTATSSIAGWRSGTLPVQAGGISHPNFAAIPATLTGLVPGGPNTVNTYLMRNQFTLTAAQAAQADWVFHVLADDACVIYVNGTEAARVNYPDGLPVEPDSLNGGAAGDESNYVSIPVNLAGRLVAGANVIAIELHQNSTSSSDAGLDFQMTSQGGLPTNGFSPLDDAFFGTSNPDSSDQTHTADGGFNGSGALRIQMGNTAFGVASQAVSGAWTAPFTLTEPATVTLSFRHRMISGQDYDNGEYQELICDVDGTPYGVITPPGTHRAVSILTGNGNGGGSQDSGWRQSSFEIPLPAGVHTLSLGGYANAGSGGFFGTAEESFEGFFDDVLITAPRNVSLLSNDTGGVPPVTAMKLTNPLHGTVTVEPDGQFLYLPEPNWSGTDTFTYRAVDGTGPSAPALVSITVTPVNDLPVAAHDGPYTTLQDVPLTVPAASGVLANDSDVDSPILTAVTETPPANGSLVLNPNGGFTFTPDSRFAGSTTFTYRASDGTGLSAPATVSLQVTDVPDDPIAAADSYTAVRNTPLAVTATAAGTLTEELIPWQAPAWRYFDSLVPAERNLGTQWRSDGYSETAAWQTGAAELGYGDGDEATLIADNPEAGFDSGAGDKFATYYFRRAFEVTDPLSITSLEVSVLFDDTCAFYLNGAYGGRTSNLPDPVSLPELAWDYYPPTGIGDNATETFSLPPALLFPGPNLIAAEVHQNAASSSDVSFDLRLQVTRTLPAGVLANDSDPDAGQTATLVAELVTPPAHGSLTLNAAGTFLYTPVTGYTGADSFTYRARDTTGRRSVVTTANFTVVLPPNIPPTARPDSYSTVEDTLLTVNTAAGVLGNDTDPEGDSFTAVVAVPPAHGTLTLNPSGSFTYQPETDFNGVDTFSYQAVDSRRSGPATVTITVSPVNDMPIAANDRYVGNPGAPFVVSAAEGVLVNDSDPDAGTVLTALLVSPPAGASLTLNLNGSFTLTASGAGTFTFTYRARDAASQSAPATVTVVLDAVPSGGPDAYTLNEDSPFAANAALGVLANDSDPEGRPITARLVTGPQQGTLLLNPDGSFFYTPARDFSGNDSFTYQVSDSVRESGPVTVSLTVNPVNDAPTTVADTYGVRVNTLLQVSAANGVLSNDSDAENSPLTATLVSPPDFGTLVFNPNGSFSYSPLTGFSGPAVFTYRASDGTSLSAVATVTLNVSALLNTVAISEIMYHPPGADSVSGEFLEVHNYGDAAVDLTGWRFTKGVNYTFPAGQLLTGRAYLAIPADRAAYNSKYPGATGATATGWGTGSSLSNGGELIRLVNAAGDVVDEVEYADEGDWAARQTVPVWDSTNTPGRVPPALDTDPGLEWITAADPDPEIGNAGGASLQLRNPALGNQNGQNWAAALPTPGARNTPVFLTNSPPLITGVIHSPAVPHPTQQVYVTAKVEDELTAGIAATLFFRSWLPSAGTPSTDFLQVVMEDNGLRQDGAAGDRVYGAVIPAHPSGTVVEFYVRSRDAAGNTRTWPAPVLDLTGGNPAQTANCLYQVNSETWTDARPLYQMIMTGADNASWNAGLNDRSSNVAPNTTVIFRTGTGHDVRYLAGVRGRGNSSRSDTPINLRLDLPKDRPWNGRTAFNLNYKYSYSQFLAGRIFESSGIPTEQAGLVGVRINGVNRALDQNGNRTFGYYCDLLPRGGDTIREWFPGNNDGNGYSKIRGNVRWGVSTLPVIGSEGYAVGGYINEGYTKQTNADANDWTDLHAWLQSLNAGTAADFDSTIAGTVDVDQWCRFLAVSTILNHAETNIANGDDDDYSVYFGATDRLCRLIPHDLDTCFNLNAIGLGDEVAPPTLTIYQCTEPGYPSDNATLPQMDKFYRNAVLGRKFKAALRHSLDTVFAKAEFDATVDRLLDPDWMGTQFSPDGNAIRSHIKAFLDTRRTTIEAFLPTAFSATTSLPLQGGIPRSTSPADLGGLGGKLDPARTASVTVNGVPVTTNPYGSTAPADNTWSAGGAILLQPGINRLVCEARDENGTVFESRTVNIWLDTPGISRSGTLAASETWSPSAGPYNITSGLTIPGGVTLTIQPGTTIWFAAGAGLTVNAGGTLEAPGTAASGISLSRIPSGAGNWGGLTVNGGTARLSHITFERNGSTAVRTQNGAYVTLSHLKFLNTAVPYLALDASSFVVSDCVFPANTASFEPVHGTGGIAPGGQGIIRSCRFGKTSGYNDSLNFTGGNRPGPILQILNCIFEGSDDDLVDIDSTDAWIEGNIFLHCHRNGGSPDSASAVSGGADNADYSQVTVINNLIYDCDNAVTMKQGNNQPNGNSAVLLNNTIVRITAEGGIDNGSGVVNFDDDNVSGEGKGMHLEGNIITDAASLTRNYNPALSRLTLTHNLLPSAPPPGAVSSGNTVADPLLNLALISNPSTATAEEVRAALTPQFCSPAIGRGPLGRDLGADLSRPGITVQSIPASVWPSSVTLAVGPSGSFTPMGQPAWQYGFTAYRHRLDNGPLSAATPSATPLSLTNLAPGPHTLLVEGRNDAATWQETPVEIRFTVVSGAPTVVLSEVLADSSSGPDFIELHNWGPAPALLDGCMISDDPALPGKFTFPAGSPAMPAGGRLVLDGSQLGFNLDKSGESLRLATASGALLDSVVFGPQLMDFSISRTGQVWRLSSPGPGSPTTAVCVLGSGSTLRINEWLGSNNIIVPGDFVELHNPDPLPVDLGGFSLTQDFRNEPAQSVLPPLSFIAGSGFLSLNADGDASAGGNHLNFKISRIRDVITLLDPSGGVVDNVMVLPGNPDVSQGRAPDGAVATAYLALPTPGFSNGSDLTADTAVMNGLRITEIMFDPPNNGPEFLEFKNITNSPLTVSGVSFDNGLNFTFPPTTLAAGGYAVITQNLPAFSALYPTVAVVPWTSGRLDNGGESLRIRTGVHGLGILDFRYGGEWYPETRSGASLQIVNASADRGSWGEKSSWQPGQPSPGGPSPFAVLAPLDASVVLPAPAILEAWLAPGPHAPENVTLTWSVLSGPGPVWFTAPVNRTTDAVFSVPGVYELALTATPPGGGAAVRDTVRITALESYGNWAARHLGSVPAARRLPQADADSDGQPNLVEFAMGTPPLTWSAGPELIISNGHLALRYSVSAFLDPAVAVIPQISPDQTAWLEGSPHLTDAVTGQNGNSVIHVVEAADPLGTGGRRFLRLLVTAP